MPNQPDQPGLPTAPAPAADGAAPRRTTVIAEAGVNHNGDLDLALRLVDAAAATGADIVKFQTFVTGEIVTGHAAKATYQLDNTTPGEGQREMLGRLELTPEMHRSLIDRCSERGLQFLSTPFDAPSIELLRGFGMRLFKIPSGDVTNLPLLRRVAAVAEEVILSTGMADLGEVEAALDALVAAGFSRGSVTLLHCHTSYPTEPADANLRAMATMRDAFRLPVGYSDHTTGTDIAVAAVALGATVIEKHLTLDRDLPGPDHSASLEPAEFAAMVTGIRRVELALGSGLKKPTGAEMAIRPAARRSVVAARTIPGGKVIEEADLAAKRPGTGISPMRWDELVGRRAAREFQPDELIEW